MTLSQPLTSLSVVIPVYNSGKTLRQLLERLEAVLPALAAHYEIILVNDGSQDESWLELCHLQENHPHLVAINLSRNFGQHNAILCGIRLANGEFIVTMDDDLQHPPEEIPKLIAECKRGFDLVYGVPEIVEHSDVKRGSTRFVKWMMVWALGMNLAKIVSPFRIFRTSLREAFANFHGDKAALDVLLSWGTTNISSVRVEHHQRSVGRSTYSFSKLACYTLTLVTGFSTRPLRFVSSLGFLFSFFGFLVLLLVLGRYLISGATVPGFAFLASIIAVFSGVQLLALGILGEYLARIHSRSTGVPTFVISEIRGENSSSGL